VPIDVDSGRFGLRHPVEVGLVGDARATLRQLVPLLPRHDNRDFLTKCQQAKDEWDHLLEERGTRAATPMAPQVVTWNLSQLLDDDAIVCGDSGTVTSWIARMPLRAQQRFSFSGTLCGMAAGLPHAIGAQIAYPGRQVVAFTGDGSLTMQMGDLTTAAQYGLPIKLIVVKNNTLGLIKWEQMISLATPEYGVGLAPVDFVKVAEACGWSAVHIEDPTRCREQLAEALRMSGPVLIEAVVDPNEPPMPPKIKPTQAKHLSEALARGDSSRVRIGLTIGRDAIEERDIGASPFGAAKRAASKATSLLNLGDRQSGDGHRNGKGKRKGQSRPTDKTSVAEPRKR
jgi:pyruvate dehydrogenase (quinone)/pyruvate oxidase